MNNKKKSASARRSPFRSILGLIAGIIGLMLGFAILNFTGEIGDLGDGEKALRIVFGIVWFTVCIGAMLLNALKLSSYSRSRKSEISPAAGNIAEITLGDQKGEGTDFEATLRKLESLRKDGLISEEEYRKKREEFVREKW